MMNMERGKSNLSKNTARTRTRTDSHNDSANICSSVSGRLSKSEREREQDRWVRRYLIKIIERFPHPSSSRGDFIDIDYVWDSGPTRHGEISYRTQEGSAHYASTSHGKDLFKNLDDLFDAFGRSRLIYNVVKSETPLLSPSGIIIDRNNIERQVEYPDIEDIQDRVFEIARKYNSDKDLTDDEGKEMMYWYYLMKERGKSNARWLSDRNFRVEHFNAAKLAKETEESIIQKEIEGKERKKRIGENLKEMESTELKTWINFLKERPTKQNMDTFQRDAFGRYNSLRKDLGLPAIKLNTFLKKNKIPQPLNIR